MKTDFHLHTNFSTDGKASMEEMIEKALSMNFTDICFTEHMDYDNTYTPEGCTDFIVDTPSYYHGYLQYKEKYEGRINILFGIELGLQQHLVEYYHAYITQYPFDFIIGSSHIADRMDPYFPEYFKNRSEEDGHRLYFQTIAENAFLFEDYDVYGHLDYALRYGPTKNLSFCYEKYADILDTLLLTIIEKGKGIELNTSGFKYGMNQPHPHVDIIKHYRNLGGEIITVGSDAHEPSYLAYEFDMAVNILKHCGFQYYTIFNNRKPSFLPL